MDQEGPNLKQCGQSTIPIFPSHPEFERYNILDQSFEPIKEGFKKENGVFLKAKKIRDKIIGYQIYNESQNFFELHDAQNVGEILSESFRSVNFTARNFLVNFSRMKKELEKEIE